MNQSDITDLARLLQNLIRYGHVQIVDTITQRVRVQSGDLLTGWIPWLSMRAGGTRRWDPPTLGEQTVLLSPGGDPSNGIALVGVYSDNNPAPSDDDGISVIEYRDGARVEYDHVESVLRLRLPGRIEIQVPGGIEIIGSVRIDGALDVSEQITTPADVVADGISVTQHVHDEQGDGQPTSPPKR